MAKNLPGVMLIDLDSGMDDAVREKAGTPGKFAEKGDLLSVEDILDMGLGASPETLYLAAKENRPDVVEVLVDMMDDIDVGVGELGNALCAAATYADGHSTLRVLLEHGANVNWQGGKYGCALQAATANYRLENVKLLLRYGADVNAQGGYYGNALTAAARHRTHFLSMAKLFLEHGVDVDAQGPGKYGNALQTAVHRKHVENVKFLLQNGASRTVKGRFGSAQMIAWSPDFSDGSDEDAQEDILAMLTEDEFVGFITER
jgi:ankyrin repeat protein